MLVENDFFFKENRILKNVLLHKSESHEKKSTVIKLKVAKLWKKKNEYKWNRQDLLKSYLRNHITEANIQEYSTTVVSIISWWVLESTGMH